MVGGRNYVSNQTPYLPEKLRGLKPTLCVPGPRDPTETETELCPECHLRRFRSAVTAAGTGALGAADLGVA